MNEMMQEVKIEINKLEKIMLKIDAFLLNAPDGCLKWQHKGEKIYYYRQYNDNNNSQPENSTLDKIKKEKAKSKWKRKYITKNNLSLAKLLAKKLLKMVGRKQFIRILQ